jgi:nucleoside-diphosphate-sugar epimerase
MLSGHKILVTGPAGQIAFPLAEQLARDNEVWGVARFSVPGSRERVEAAGIRAVRADLASDDYSQIPSDFEYVLHLAAAQEPGEDYNGAIRANAEATGLLLSHCRKAKAALVMSTHSVYKPVEDPLHVFKESDPLGDVNSSLSPPYSMSKIGQEAVARTCARLFDLPVTIGRMNASYGPNGGLPAYHADAIRTGQPVVTRWDPCPYSPIHQDDINSQTEALLDAASVPATIVNWAGDEAVSVQEWTAYLAELSGLPGRLEVVSTPGTLRGSIADVSRRNAFTGPCRVSWKDGFRQTWETRAREAASNEVTG